MSGTSFGDRGGPGPLDGRTPKIAVVGLGYVGLPLAIEFAGLFDVVGYDTNAGRIADLGRGEDRTGEVDRNDLEGAERLAFTDDPAELAGCNVYVVAVPTPVDEAQRPDLGYLVAASETVGKLLRPGDVVVYESTVYPGTTEEVCIPVLESCSKLGCRIGTDARDEDGFYVGYSPERINPGDPAHRLREIAKVTSGSTPAAAEFVDALYRRIIHAGTHRASSIRVAEASKVIENIQRDVNIALMNELAMVFDKMGIDTREVLQAAATKWNFLPFRPGLVGGHCIGVDPYYLTHKATVLGYNPELTLSARRINNKMAIFAANKLMRLMARKSIGVPGSRVLVLGFTFKENCPDLRNTRVAELVGELRGFNARVDVYDPHADSRQVESDYGIELIRSPEPGAYDAVVLAVAHDEFRRLDATTLAGWTRDNAVIYDLKHVLPPGTADANL